MQVSCDEELKSVNGIQESRRHILEIRSASGRRVQGT